ncbi:MAG: hypothetical protein KAX49_07335 [Halanaerobiales bacterium]|nr:hypothetical protein [Halanaerobiales bacterium]
MKITGKINRALQTKDNAILELAVNNPFQSIVLSLDREKIYSFDINEVKSKRSNQQNRYMWVLITLCVEKQTGRKNKDDIDALYIKMLEYTGAKVDYILILEEAFERFKKEVRLAVPQSKMTNKGQIFLNVKVVYGSSKLNTKEMGLLIENLLDYAENLGIETNYWKDALL